MDIKKNAAQVGNKTVRKTKIPRANTVSAEIDPIHREFQKERTQMSKRQEDKIRQKKVLPDFRQDGIRKRHLKGFGFDDLMSLWLLVGVPSAAFNIVKILERKLEGRGYSTNVEPRNPTSQNARLVCLERRAIYCV